jgi:hypothetical protein
MAQLVIRQTSEKTFRVYMNNLIIGTIIQKGDTYTLSTEKHVMMEKSCLAVVSEYERLIAARLPRGS